MSVLDVSKCKKRYITSILDNEKSFDDPKDTANIFNNFLANVGKTSYRKFDFDQYFHTLYHVRIFYALYKKV